MRIIYTIISSVVLAALAFKSHASEWKELSADKAKIHFDAIDGARTYFVTAWSDDWRTRHEVGGWFSSTAPFPRAELMLQEPASHVYFRDRETLKSETLKQLPFLSDKDVELIDKAKFKGIEYWRFRIPEAECIGILKLFGEPDMGGATATIAGTKAVFGYYCDRKLDQIEPILNALDVSK